MLQPVEIPGILKFLTGHMAVLARLGQLAQHGGKRRAFARIRLDREDRAARPASDDRLFRQRLRQEPPERLKARFAPFTGGSRPVCGAHRLPSGMLVQYRAQPLVRREKLRLRL